MQQKPSDLIPTKVRQKRPNLIGDFGTFIFIMAIVAHVAISGSVTLESPSAAEVLLSPVLFSAFPAVHQNRARVLLGNSRKMKNKNKTENRELGHNNNVTLSWISKIYSEKREKKEHIQDSDFDFFTIQKSHPVHQNGEQKISRKRSALPSRRLPTLSDAVPFPSTLAPCPSAPPTGPGWGWFFMPQGLMHPIGLENVFWEIPLLGGRVFGS